MPKTERASIIRTLWDITQACHNPAHRDYHRYGAKGVTVCDEWRQDRNCFVAYMGPRPAGWHIDRPNRDLPYQRGNCQWAPPTVARRAAGNVKLCKVEVLEILDLVHARGVAVETIPLLFNVSLVQTRRIACGAARYQPGYPYPGRAKRPVLGDFERRALLFKHRQGVGAVDLAAEFGITPTQVRLVVG